jgi:hypothetical protein
MCAYGYSQLLDELEAIATEMEGAGKLPALLRDAADWIRHERERGESYFNQAMENGIAARQLREDAERYRWLRDRKGCPFAETDDDAWDDLDAAIDAAMSAATHNVKWTA